jgi:hypothetical protein
MIRFSFKVGMAISSVLLNEGKRIQLRDVTVVR